MKITFKTDLTYEIEEKGIRIISKSHRPFYFPNDIVNELFNIEDEDYARKNN